MENIRLLRFFILSLYLCVLFLPASSQESAVKTAANGVERTESRTVSQEVNISDGATLAINNISRPLVIKSWDEKKVKIVTTVYYEGNTTLTDAEWFERLGIAFKATSGQFSIHSDYNSGKPAVNKTPGDKALQKGSVVLFNGKGEYIGTKEDVKRTVTIYFPADTRLNIDNKLADLKILNNVGNARINISNGSLQMLNAGLLILNSKYGDFEGGDLQTANIDFSLGHFRANNIHDLTIRSESSTIIAGNVMKAAIQSVNDEYEFDEAGIVQCTKKFNSFQIDKLLYVMEMNGAGADVKIRNIMPTVTSLMFEDKYCSLRLPLTGINNFSVDFIGIYTKVFANFEKVSRPLVGVQKEEPVMITAVRVNSPGKDGTKAKPDNAEKKINPQASITLAEQLLEDPPSFTAKSGNGEGTKIKMNCYNCTVDFK